MTLARGGVASKEAPTIPSGRKRPGRPSRIGRWLSRVASGRRSSMTHATVLGRVRIATAILAFGVAPYPGRRDEGPRHRRDRGRRDPAGRADRDRRLLDAERPHTALGLDQQRSVEVALTRSATSWSAIRSSSSPRTASAMPKAARWQRPSSRPFRTSWRCWGPTARARPRLGRRSCGTPGSSASGRRPRHPRSPQPTASPTISASCGRSTVMPMPASSTPSTSTRSCSHDACHHS